ncbi:AraC family transcriptional regulator [Duganella sp. FT27W]|uniref:helix-turn-helix transcriptional regulator n=1 Tax=Duganella sp. FT27W TaxID=2654636 RepID=UPI00128E2C5B|nr:AraC family transcriptional regulator [Duganella sp. FT27W]MPQ59221.1 AraC family transcriptional regulator [Duganella sp. FT27W]
MENHHIPMWAACPDPLARAPRVAGTATTQSLRLAPPSLNGALVALIGRDLTPISTQPGGHLRSDQHDQQHASQCLESAQCLTHFPASPLVTISWFPDMDAGLVTPQGWQSFGAPVVLSGTQSAPMVSWTPTPGRGYMACFTADAAQALFDVDMAAIQNRFVPAAQALDARFAPLLDALLASRDQDVLAVLERHLAPRWQVLQGRASAAPSLRQVGRHWVERLAWHAHGWRNQHSPRHVERRIKSFSGRSLREWQALTRTEGLFFAARDRHEAGQPFDWAGLALEEGFADQAHMNRTVKRITGFAPAEFAQRFIEDESFWMYRLWV